MSSCRVKCNFCNTFHDIGVRCNARNDSASPAATTRLPPTDWSDEHLQNLYARRFPPAPKATIPETCRAIIEAILSIGSVILVVLGIIMAARALSLIWWL